MVDIRSSCKNQVESNKISWAVHQLDLPFTHKGHTYWVVQLNYGLISIRD